MISRQRFFTAQEIERSDSCLAKTSSPDRSKASSHNLKVSSNRPRANSRGTRFKGYQARRSCKLCQGARLRPEILAVTVRDLNDKELNIHEFCALTIEEAKGFIENILLSKQQRSVATEVLREIRNRLTFLVEVGLGYLTLNRESGTLSGGEAQRIRLGTQIGSGLAGVLYVLDEPSIGLHQRDNERLLATLQHLRDLGNTVVVVEHDEDTIRAADFIIDLGPGAGPRGGQIVASGSIQEIERNLNR